MGPLLLHIYGERQDDQWVLICLEFSLCVQSDSLKDAEKRLREQILGYIKEATVGVDREHAGMLLRRSAPLKYWLKFYAFRAWCSLMAKGKPGSHTAKISPLPMVPAAA